MISLSVLLARFLSKGKYLSFTGKEGLANRLFSFIFLLFIVAPLQAQTGQEWVKRYNNAIAGLDSYATALVVDNQSNGYVTGFSRGNGTAEDYATVKYDGQGLQLWVQRYDGPEHKDDSPATLILDSEGNVYVTGNSGTVKYDPQGKQLWVQREGGSALAIDSQDDVYVTGSSQVDYVVTKYDPQGSQLWQQTYGTADRDEENLTTLSVDWQGNVYVTGSITSGNIYAPHYYLTVKYSSQGELQWAQTYMNVDLASGTFAFPTAMVVDGQGNVYVTGNSTGIDSEGNSTQENYATIKYQWFVNFWIKIKCVC